MPASIKNKYVAEIYLQFNSGINDDNRIVIFYTDDDFKHLENSNTILVDGTFKYCSRKFKQL